MTARLSRAPVHAAYGAVATSQPLATSAGLAVLRQGGSAVDAALAAAVTLTVVQPTSNDIGGDLFAIVWDGSRLHGLNASGRSPAALTLDAVLSAAGGQPRADAFGGAQADAPRMPERGWLPVTVPGAPAGWRDLHARFGRLPFAALFTDAIGYAERGYPVSPTVAAGWARAAEQVYPALAGPQYEEWGRIFAPAPGPGELWRNPDAARTLRLIATSNAGDFYHGEIAAALCGYAELTGGLLTRQDLAAHASTWVDPISARYGDLDVWELPPNGQGVAALLALRILDGLDLAAATPEQRVHLQVEAIKLAFADAHAYVADPDATTVSPADLLDEAYVAPRRALIGERAARPGPGQPRRGGTVYLCAADRDGMMVSLIQSNYLGFGSYVVLPGYGFGLQNRGAGFSLDPAHPNAVAGGKRPYHTIIPGFATRGGQPVGPFGVMGGHMQPQGHVQVVLATVDAGADPQEALELPRWYWHTGLDLRLEDGFDDAVARALADRGHRVTIGSDPSTFGYGQVIWRTPAGFVAGSEPRADGCALGW